MPPSRFRFPATRAPRWPRTLAAGRFATLVRRGSPEGCALALLGLPDDTGVRLNGGRPGAAGGPDALRAALARYGAAEALAWPPVYDAGDVVPGNTLEETHARVTAATAAVLEAGLLPVAVGGGHDLTLATVRAVAARHPGLQGIYFDAHLDVRETRGSGMPFRRLILEAGIRRLHLHGYRRFVNTRAHRAWFERHGGRIRPDDAPVRLPRARHLFASFDLDVLDAAHAPGVSALNPAGWTVREAERWVEACGAARAVRFFDLMELNPAFDPDGRTARVAAHLFLAFLAGFARRKSDFPRAPVASLPSGASAGGSCSVAENGTSFED